jgi:nickel-dependent lactate racemase
VRLPPGWFLTTIGPNRSTPLPDLRLAVEAALAQPLQAPRLRDLASNHARVCIVFTDATRACPDHILVPAILRELASAGVPDDYITVLCATGLHRASTREEKIAKLGADVVERYQVVDHDAMLEFDPCLAGRDLIIATGVVEPHQYAGYSGGGKTVVIGCGSESTIELTHGPQFLDQPGVRLGQIDGNPFQQFVREAAQTIGLKFVVNVVLDGEGRAIAAQAGDPIAVHDALVAVARSVYEVSVPRQYEVVIAQVDPPKDVNLYQASRATTYIGLSATPPISPSGVIIVAARCPEGAGTGRGEQRFFTTLSQASDLQELLAEFRRSGCQAGEQRTYMLAQVLLKHEIVVAGSLCPAVIRACHLIPAASIDEALVYARRRCGVAAHVLYLPHPLQTLPIVRSRP